MPDDAAKLVVRVRQQPDPNVQVAPKAQFDSRGGTIGRSGRCDLTLPDPTNLVSRQHLEVTFEQGTFYARDTSANGLFINGASESVGDGNRVALGQGDRLRLGDYELVVETCSAASVPDGRNSAPIPEASLSGNPFARENAPAQPPSNDGLPEIPEPGGRETPAGSGAAADPFGVPPDLAPDPFEGDLPKPGGGSGSDPVAPSVGRPDDEADAPIIPDDYDPLADIQGESPAGESAQGPAQPDHTPGWRTPVADVMGTPRQPSQEGASEPEQGRGAARRETPSAAGDADRALAAFCRGAGIDPKDLDAGDPETLLERAGGVFAQLGQGMSELLQGRAAFKQEFRVQRTVLGPSDNNPLKFAADPERAPAQLLTTPARGYMPPERAVAEAIADIKDHEVALVAAMHRALEHVLAEFEPDRLEQRLSGASLRDVIPGGRRARTWDLYRAHYEQLARGAEDIFEGALGREFVKAYEESERRS